LASTEAVERSTGPVLYREPPVLYKPEAVEPDLEPLMPKHYDVFLSYNAKDRKTVEGIAAKLRAASIEPFLDAEALRAGRRWQQELEKALRESEAFAAFFGPHGLGDWQEEEIGLALSRQVKEKNFPVVPVLLKGGDPEHLSGLLRQRTWVDLRKDDRNFQNLLQALRKDGAEKPPLPSPSSFRSMAPAPDVFIPRREYEPVIEALCSPQAGATVGITTALRGAGGFGKTALALKVCEDPRVQAAFPDGILWATMGENLKEDGRIEKVRELIRWWIDEDPPSFTSLEGAGAKLREILDSRRVLIVVDDVWSPLDLIPFKGLHAGAVVLTTTRNRQTLPMDAHPIEVDAMVLSEGLSLLRLGLPPGSYARLAQLVRRLGEWPLLLKLVNGQLRKLVQDLSLEEALNDIEEDLNTQGVVAFDQEDREERNRAAARTLEVSLDRLSSEERDLYERLAIFPEDADVPLTSLEKLWGLGPKKLCERFHDLSLLLRFDRREGTIRLHDVFRSYLLERRKEDLPALHRGFLDAFHPKSGHWADLPKEETYFWRNLAHHLLGAGERESLRDLFFDFDYLRAKLEATDVNALTADYAPLEEDSEVRTIQGALRLSAHVLGKDKCQLAGQLLGRLLAFGDARIQALLRIAQEVGGLRPRLRSLMAPGGALLRTFAGSGRVTSVAGAGGRRAISGYFDGKLRVWDLDTGEALHTFEGHTSGVTAVAVVDGRRAVSSSYDGTLRVWDLDTGEALRILEGPTGGVTAVAVVDARRAVSGSDDGTLRVWDLDTGEALHTFEGHTSGVTAVASLDARRAVSGSHDGTLRVWDLDTGEALHTFEGHTSGVIAVAVVDGRRAVSGSYDGTLRVWDLDTGEALRTLEGHTNWVTAVAMVNGRRAISGSNDGTFRVWDLDTREALPTLERHIGRVNAVAVVDGRRAVSGSNDGMLRVWDLDTGEALRTLEGHTSWVTAVAMVDGRRAVSGSVDGTLRVWDIETGEALRTLKGPTGRVTPVAVVDGRRAVSGSIDGRLWVWDLDTGEAPRTLEGRTGEVTAVAVVDGRRVVSGSTNEKLRVWDLDIGEALRTLEGHTNTIAAVAVVDGRAVSGSHDGTLRVWDLDTGQSLHTLEGHTDWVTAVAVVDARRAVSGSSDRTLRVWDLETGEVLTVMTLDAPVMAVAVEREGRIVVAGDSSGRVHFFDWVGNRADCASTTSPPGPLSQGERGKDGS
jgi:WD40 repeat protein